MVPILETPRLILRPLQFTDAPDIQRQFPHFEILKYISGVPWPYPENGAEEFLREFALPAMKSGKSCFWAITVNNEFTGVISLDEAKPASHIGFWMGSGHQGKGYMREAISGVYDYAFGKAGFAFLIITNSELNLPSHRLQELSGASIVASDQVVDYPAGPSREIRWKLTPEAWSANRHKFLPVIEGGLHGAPRVGGP